MVPDEEIREVLSDRARAPEAGEALIEKALDRDGHDNITVVVARFDGEALQAATREDVVSFVRYDPGSDPVPEPMGTLRRSSIGRETVEERLPTELLGAEDDVPTKTDAATGSGGSAARSGAASRHGRAPARCPVAAGAVLDRRWWRRRRAGSSS